MRANVTRASQNLAALRSTDRLIGADTSEPTTDASLFDYASLPPDKARLLRQSVAAIRRIQSAAIADVGNHLIAAKELVGHGAFSRWAELELGMLVRSAENYMRAAKFLAGKSATISLLPHAVIYALAAPSAPQNVVRKVVEAAEAGIPLSPAKIKQDLKESARTTPGTETPATEEPEPDVRIRSRDGSTPEQIGRRALAAQKAGKPAGKISKELGTSPAILMQIIDIIVIADRDDLCSREQEAAQRALATMGETDRVPYSMVQSIARRLWGDPVKRRGRDRKNLELKRYDQFCRAIGAITAYGGDHDLELEVAHLRKDQAEATCADVERTIRNLQALRRSIGEMHR